MEKKQNDLEINDLIKVTQIPLVEYSKLKEFNALIMNKIESLDLSNIKATEENLSTLTSTRASLRKDLTKFEDSRKFTEKTILAPYKEFEKIYKELIFKPLSESEKMLKVKVDTVKDMLIMEKTDTLKEMFNDYKETYEIDFVKFEDVRLNVQMSTSMKKLEDEILEFFDKIKNDMDTIGLVANDERVLAEYTQCLDVTLAIQKVTRLLEVENAIKEKQNEVIEKVEKVETVKKQEVKEVQKLTKAHFTVIGTTEQLQGLADYMKGKGITYE